VTVIELYRVRYMRMVDRNCIRQYHPTGRDDQVGHGPFLMARAGRAYMDLSVWLDHVGLVWLS
jgi:hypothetical protein